ncbi:MAG: SRPBCC family protein [Knoellia sp.]
MEFTEFGTLEREIRIDAAPEVVLDVISRPEHIREWWSDDASLEACAGPGAVGELVWADRVEPVPFVVVQSDPPRTFSFRWTSPDGQLPASGNSLLVTIDLESSPSGTVLRLTETGFREKGWEAAVLEEAFHDHERGWDFFLPRLRDHAAKVAGAR